jgi:tetratricopeptide (TPR) repeat protein
MKCRSNRTLPRLSLLTLTISLLGACAHQQSAPQQTSANSGTVSAAAGAQPAAPARSGPAVRQAAGSRTLADLENRDVVIEQGEVQQPTAEEALNNYQTALALFQDPTSRMETLERMAQFTMQASTNTPGAPGTPGGTGPKAAAPAGDERVQANEQANLFGSVMLGRSILPSGPVGPDEDRDPHAAAPKVSYTTATRLYLKMLEDSTSPVERADAYYQLAKAYDLNGQRKDSINTLRKLIKEYPASPNYVEANFRVAEDDFSNSHFLEAADRYAVVAKLDKTEFRDQAIYKQGWALYKASDYEGSLPVFFTVAEELREKASHKLSNARQSNISKLLDDVYHIISLGFIQLDGYRSADAYFAKFGAKPYEADTYMKLGQTYQEKHQYRNAAETFEDFVKHHPMDPRAPEFSSATIVAYQEGGFPTEVIPAKQNFIKRYGPGSQFWEAGDDKLHDTYRPMLLGHIIDMAKFTHANAQKTGAEVDYMKAADWYNQYLALKPAPTDAMAINELLAEALFSAKHFAEAITEFEKTAYSYPNPKAVDPAYLALVSYQELADGFKGTPEEDKSWFDKRVASSLKYAAHFPGDVHTPVILEGITNEQLKRKDVAGAMQTAHVIVALKPPAPEKVQLESWMVIGDGEFDLNHQSEAEAAYRRVLAYQTVNAKDKEKYQNRMAASIYKQAEARRDKNDIDGAVADFLRIGSTGADVKMVSAAQFDAATLLLNNKRYAQAIPILNEFRQKYPQHELSATIPDKLALAYEQTGQSAPAAHEYENIANANMKTNAELAREAEWTAAGLYEKANMPTEAIRIYQSYVGAFPTPLDVFDEAQFKLYSYYDTQHNVNESHRWLLALATTYDNAGTARTNRISYLGAMAHYKMCQPLYDDFAGIALKQPLKQSLGTKKLAMQKALEAYKATGAIGVAEFTTSSNYQIAEIYRKLATDLRDSERPKGLGQDELDQYAELLDEQATPFEDKSIDLYVANANLAKQNIYDEPVRKSFEALAKLSPGRYNKHEQPEPSVDVIY